MAAFALALVLRAAATVAASATGATTPGGGIASGLRVLTDPGRPARAFEAPGMSAIAYWSVVTLSRPPHGARLVRLETGRPTPAPDCSRPSPDPGHRNRTGHRRRGFQEGPPTTRRHPPSLDPAPEAERRRLPHRTQLWAGDLGIGRGLDPRHRSPALRQGSAPRHQRHPRRARRRRHHLHAARQHRRHHRRAQRTRPSRRIRPTAPHRRTARSRRQRSPVVADPRL